MWERERVKLEAGMVSDPAFDAAVNRIERLYGMLMPHLYRAQLAARRP